ncbi:HipA N-terminal domain-containing protein [Phyllobacterium sp. K27]
MARRRAHVPLNVFLNSRHVGVLRREATGAIDFRYGPGWLDWHGTFPVSLCTPFTGRMDPTEPTLHSRTP